MLELTALLNQAAAGDAEAENRAYTAIYDELRQLAKHALGDGPADGGATMGVTALVHEAFLRLTGGEAVPWNTRHEFFAYAARVMRNLLVDAARRRAASKHGGDLKRCDDAAEWLADAASVTDMLDVDQRLTALAALDQRLAEVVELHVFAGLAFTEIAQCLNVAQRTVLRDWSKARLILRDFARADERV